MECLLMQVFVVLLILVLWDKLLGRKTTGPQWTANGGKINQGQSEFQREYQTVQAAAVAQMNRPGYFYVLGVDRASGYETKDRVYADNSTNAKVKCELQGVVVTSVWPEA